MRTEIGDSGYINPGTALAGENRALNYKRSSGRGTPLWFFALILTITAKASVIILDAAAAVVPVTKFAPDPLPASILAHGPKVVASDINVAACLRIAANRNNPSAPARTLESAIVVNDVANALVEAIERGLHPISPHGLADSAKGISMRLDFPAGLGIRSARTIPAVAIAVPVSIPVAIAISVPVTIVVATVLHAAELAIDIFNRATAAGEGFKIGIHPLAIAVLAACAQNVIAHANFTAGLAIAATGQRAILVAD